MIVGGRRHYRQGCQIESLDNCVAGDDVERVEVTDTETVSTDKKACGGSVRPVRLKRQPASERSGRRAYPHTHTPTGVTIYISNMFLAN